MSEKSGTKRKPLWLYVLVGIVIAIALVFLIVGNGAFVRSFVLPRVAAQLNSDIQTEDVSFSPFSSLTLRGFKLVPKGDEPLLTAKEVRVRYSLFSILRGNIVVNEVLLDTPQFTLVQRSATDSNLAKVLGQGAKSTSEPTPASASAPQIDIQNVAIKDGLFRLTDRGTVSEVSGFSLNLDQLKNGGSGKLTLAGLLKQVQGADQLAGAFKSSFDIGLTPQLLPSGLKGGFEFTADQAAGAFKDFARLGASLQVDASPTELRQFQLNFRKEGQSLGTVGLSGTLALEKKEARLNYEIQGLDRRVLGIVVAGKGLDVGQSRVSAKGSVDMTKEGQIVASKGRLAVDQFSLAMTNGVTPVVDVAFDYQVSTDLAQQTALIQKADLSVKQGAKSLVTGALDRPMNLAWGKNNPGYGESVFSLGVANFNLADWKVFLGPTGPSGVLSTDLKVQSESDGRLLKFTLGTALDGLSVVAGSNRIDRAQVRVSAKGSVEGFKAINVETFAVEVDRLGQSILKMTGLAAYNLETQDVGGQTTGQLELPAALGAFPVPDIAVSAGQLKFSSQFNQKATGTNVTAAVNLANLTGKVGSMVFKDYSVNFDAAVDVKQGQLNVNRATVTAQTGFTAGGSLDVNGKYDLARSTGQFAFKTIGLSQSAIGPFVAAALQPNELKSVALDLNGQATLEEGGASAVKLDLAVSKLVVHDPAGRIPSTPLSAGIGLDAGVKGTVVDLKKFLLSLEPTARATNQLLVTAHIDTAATNATPSTLVVKSDGLDLTTFYDLFAGNKPAAGAEEPAKPVTVAPAGDPLAEPAPVALPFKKFDASVSIARFYLRDVALSNFTANARIDNGTVQLNPFSVSVNGAPVSATVLANLGVPGYQYDLKLDAQSIPVAPFAKSFGGSEKLLLNGGITAKAALKGAGVTGASLRRNLSGTTEVSAAGLDYHVELSKNRLIKNVLIPVLSTILRIPNLGQSPVQTIALKATAGEGNVNLSEVRIQSPSFEMHGAGVIQIADVLTNSTLNVPMHIALMKDGKPDPVPDFLTVAGTLGNPKTKIDPIGVAKASARLPGGVGQLVGGTIDTATNIVNKLTGGVFGNLLGGRATNAPAAGESTNKTAAPQQPAANPIDALKGLFPGKKKN